MNSKVGEIRNRKQWERWIAEHLPAAQRFEGDIPSIVQVEYPAYQIDAVDVADARAKLVALLEDFPGFPLVAFLTGEPTPLAYLIEAKDLGPLMIETGRRGEFLSLYKATLHGELLVEHPEDKEGRAPFWLSGAGSFESFVLDFANRLPGGTLYTTHAFSVEGR